MTFDAAKLKKSTWAILSFLLVNATIPQIEWARDKILPLIVTHPKLTPVALSIFGVLITLHSPTAQKMLHDVFDRKPDVPAEPGAVMGTTEVVTKPE
jgi:hypothetical protein